MGPYISLESAALPFPRAIFPLLKGSAYQNGIGVQEEAGKSKFFLFETFLLFYLYFFSLEQFLEELTILKSAN